MSNVGTVLSGIVSIVQFGHSEMSCVGWRVWMFENGNGLEIF